MTQQIHDSAKSLKIFLIAGEASGDVIGGKLMQAMKSAADERGYTITFDGIGGEHMAAAGLKTRFPMRELSLIGIAEILPICRNYCAESRKPSPQFAMSNPIC